MTSIEGLVTLIVGLSYPNYTGSVGYGDKFVRKLVGRIGDLDVKDCLESVNHLIKVGVARAGAGQQFISGGSHGGFLGTHCECGLETCVVEM